MTRRENLTLMTALFAGKAAAQGPATYSLPKLPYALDALEPHVDARTMEIHHGKHHQAYVDNLNKVLATQPSVASKPLKELLSNLDAVPEAIRTAVRNHGGGHANHSLFWETLAPAKGQAPKGALASAINKSFKSQSEMEDRLKTAAMGVFGSGWAWLALDSQKRLVLTASPNQDSPLSRGLEPLFGIDVWEHAYYLKYQNRRADYLGAILKVGNWDLISSRYETLSR